MATYRVGPGGLLVTDRDGTTTVLDAGTILDAIPDAYDGKLEVIELDDADQKRVHGYADKRVHPDDKRL